MNQDKQSSPVEVLSEIVNHNQVWGVMAAKYAVENPLPPWKTSLDGLCDVLDRACTQGKSDFSFKDRRDEEDVLSGSIYATLPYPENQLVALAHSLVARGLIDETELRIRLERIRNRLEAE